MKPGNGRSEVAAEKQNGVGTPYIPPMMRRLKCRIDSKQSPSTCMLPEHKRVRRGREMIDSSSLFSGLLCRFRYSPVPLLLCGKSRRDSGFGRVLLLLLGLALGREIGGAARFRGRPMIVVNTEPGGGRVNGLSDAHDTAERAVRCERVPSGEGHPFVHQFYSVGAPRGVEPLTS